MGQDMGASKLIIFDVDGTLFQTQYVTVPAVQQAFTSFGLAVPAAEDICSFFGKTVEAYETWLAGQCPVGHAISVIETANAFELRFIEEYGRLYPNVRETLSCLKGVGYVLAICSNGPEPYVQEVVKAHGLGDFFSDVRARGTFYKDKAEMVGASLDLIQPKTFILVGDRRDDIEAAHYHNGRGIAATYGFGSPEEWRDADACINSISELPRCVEKFFSL